MNKNFDDVLRLHGLTLCKNEAKKVLGLSLKGLDSIDRASLKRIRVGSGSSKTLYLTVDVYSYKWKEQIDGVGLKALTEGFARVCWPDGYLTRHEVASLLWVSEATVSRGLVSNGIQADIKGSGRRPGLYSSDKIIAFLFGNRE